MSDEALHEFDKEICRWVRRPEGADRGVPGPAIVYPDGLVIYVDLEGKYLMEDQWTPKEAADYFK
jgi:hypothetical protein